MATKGGSSSSTSPPPPPPRFGGGNPGSTAGPPGPSKEKRCLLRATFGNGWTGSASPPCPATRLRSGAMCPRCARAEIWGGVGGDKMERRPEPSGGPVRMYDMFTHAASGTTCFRAAQELADSNTPIRPDTPLAGRFQVSDPEDVHHSKKKVTWSDGITVADAARENKAVALGWLSTLQSLGMNRWPTVAERPEFAWVALPPPRKLREEDLEFATKNNNRVHNPSRAQNSAEHRPKATSQSERWLERHRIETDEWRPVVIEDEPGSTAATPEIERWAPESDFRGKKSDNEIVAAEATRVERIARSELRRGATSGH